MTFVFMLNEMSAGSADAIACNWKKPRTKHTVTNIAA
jgi:hypothetical protein